MRMKRTGRRVRTAAIALAVLAAALGGLRAALPALALRRLNAKLGSLKSGWHGEAKSLRVELLRGRFSVDGLELENEAKDMSFRLHSTRFDVRWGPLLKKRHFVADAELDGPKVRLVVKRRSKKELEEKKPVRAAELPDLSKVLPFRFDRVVVKDGEIIIRESDAEMKLSAVRFSVSELTNAPDGEHGPYAKGELGAETTGGGRVFAEFTVDPVAPKPAFGYALKVEHVDLAAINPVLRFQFGVDVDKGTFELVSEATAKDGGYSGYVKPFVEGLKMGPTHGPKKSLGKVLKEAVVGAAAAVLKSRKTDAVAAKAPFSGSFEDPDVGTWEAFFSTLRNAFVAALKPTFEKEGG